MNTFPAPDHWEHIDGHVHWVADLGVHVAIVTVGDRWEVAVSDNDATGDSGDITSFLADDENVEAVLRFVEQAAR